MRGIISHVSEGITYMLEGNLEEFPPDLQARLLLGFEHEPSQTGQLEEAKQTVLTNLTMDEMRQLKEKVSPDAWRILVEVAKQPKGYSFEDLQKATSLRDMNIKNGLSIAGRLSSLGHQMNDFKGRKSPLRKDVRARKYSMDPEIAKTILVLASEKAE